MHLNYPRLVSNMRTVLVKNGLLESFKTHTPSVRTGYAYDTCKMMETLKTGVTNDKHSDSSFVVCCTMLKKNLGKETNHINENMICK